MGRRLGAGLLLGLALALVGVVVIAVGQIDPERDMEERLGLQWMFSLRGPVPAPSDAVVIAIDEESAFELGLPAAPSAWPRSLHAELVRHLASQGARVICFDLTFQEPTSDDEAFARALAAAGNVLLTESFVGEQQSITSGDVSLGTATVEGSKPLVPILAQAARAHVPFLLPNAARVDLYWPLVGTEPDMVTLPVMAFHAYAGGDLVRLRDTLDGAVYLNHYGPLRSITTVPYSTVLAAARGSAVPKGSVEFRGKAVFVGYSAATQSGQGEQKDDYRTVYSRPDGLGTSGVEIAATAFANLVDGRRLKPLGAVSRLALVTAWGLALGLICAMVQPVRATLAVCALSVLYLGFAYAKFAGEAWWLPSIVPAGIQLPLAVFAGVWLSYRVANRERELIRRAFSYFLPGPVVDQLAHNVGPVTSGNRVVYGACLATDVEGYTTLAEQMDPGKLGELMNQYYAHLFVPVERTRGVVVDVVGDAMIAIWAKASGDAQLRRSACQAALDIVKAVDGFNEPSAGRSPLLTRFGLHAGDMLLGSVGAAGHYEYRAVGDIVNTASRIQGLNKILGTRLLASRETVADLELATRPLGSFLMAGKANAVEVVEVLGATADVDEGTSTLCTMFADALDAYRRGRWGEAGDRFAAALDAAPGDGPSRFYLARCKRLAADAPGHEWSATIRIESK